MKKHLRLSLYKLSILFFGLNQTAFSQKLDKKSFFHKDLYTLSKQNKTNLTPKKNDETRVKVARFNNKHSSFTIENERDSTITACFWFRPKNIELHSGTLFGEENNFQLRYLSNKQLQFSHLDKKNIETKSILTNDRWQHLGFSISEKGQLSIFFNGIEILSDSISSDWWKEKKKIILGTDQVNMNSEGSIDDLQIWNRKLSHEEMKMVFTQSQMLPALDFGLNLYLPLKENLENFIDNKITLSESRSIKFVKDSTGRKSTQFDYNKSYIKYQNIHFKNQQTIAFWVKPASTNNLISLIGNSDFSLSYLTKPGTICYSTPLEYSSKSKKVKIATHEWFHLAVALNYNHSIDYYINGEKIDSQLINKNKGKADYIELGQSLSKNSFEGNMSNIAIWDRKLSDHEIKEVFNGKLENIVKEKSSGYSILLYFPLPVLLFSIIIYDLLNKRKKKKKIQ